MCNEVYESQSIISVCSEAVFAASVLIVARTIKTRRGSQLRGKENSYRKMPALRLAKQRGSWTEHKSPLNEGHNKWRLFGRRTEVVIDIESNQKCNHTFLPERRPESVWKRPPFHHGPHTFHMLRASTNPEAPNNIMGMFVDCDGKEKKLEKTSTYTGRTRKLLTETSIRANGRLLWSYATWN